MVQTMDQNKVRNEWEQEESIAHIHGWDFSHIHGRYEEENDLPWDYETIVRQYLTPDMRLLDYDTGGGEFLLSLGHPHDKTAAAAVDTALRVDNGVTVPDPYRFRGTPFKAGGAAFTFFYVK